jgi:hypothetical protein
MSITELLLEIMTSLLERLKESKEFEPGHEINLESRYPSMPIPDSAVLSLNNLISTIKESHSVLFSNLYKIYITDKSDLLLVTNDEGYLYTENHQEELKELATLKMGCNEVYVLQVDEEATQGDIDEAVDGLLTSIYGGNDLVCAMLETPKDNPIRGDITVKELMNVVRKLGLEDITLSPALAGGFLKEVLNLYSAELLLEASYLIEEERG